MHPQAIHLSDLHLLRELFAPETKNVLVCDPHQRLTGALGRPVTFIEEPPKEAKENSFFVNLASGQTEKQSEPVLFIGTHDGARAQHFYYINNPDGTIRWIFDSDEHSSAFLNLYNTGTLRGRLYRTITQFAWSIGQGHRMVSGLLLVQQELVDGLRSRMEIEQAERLSIFTGTRGATRKIVLGVHTAGKTTDFIKIPLSEEAQNNIENEKKMLTLLNKYDFTTLSLPRLSSKISGTARISNIRPAVTIPLEKINAIHVKAVAELYQLSHERKRISDTAAWQVTQANMESMKQEMAFTGGVQDNSMRKLLNLLRKLHNSISAEEQIAVSVSHGDFTPWNMFCDEQRLYVYDWEMARNGIPMYFDLYHFSFQTGILQQQKGWPKVKEAIRNWKQMPLVQSLDKKYNVNHSLHFRLYLLFVASYYLRQYMAEKELLHQAHWMIDAWTSAIEEVLEPTHNTH